MHCLTVNRYFYTMTCVYLMEFSNFIMSLFRRKLYGSEWWSWCAASKPAVQLTAKRHDAQQHERTEVERLHNENANYSYWFFSKNSIEKNKNSYLSDTSK